MDTEPSKRPRFREAFQSWIDEQGIRSYQKMAEDLSKAGYRPGKGGNLYPSKISGFINTNEGVPDEFFWWLLMSARASRMTSALTRCELVERRGAELPSLENTTTTIADCDDIDPSCRP
jgi:hypothetical protein